MVNSAPINDMVEWVLREVVRSMRAPVFWSADGQGHPLKTNVICTFGDVRHLFVFHMKL